jgi:hypothetical protein
VKKVKKTTKKSTEKVAKKTAKVAKTVEKIKNKNLAPILMICAGLLFGVTLIGLGVYNNINASYNEFKVRSEEDLKADIDAKNGELNQLLKERDGFSEDAEATEEFATVVRKISSKESEIYELDAELYKVQSGFYRDLHMKQYLDSVPLILLGASAIVFSIGMSMRVSNKTKNNKILTVIEEK